MSTATEAPTPTVERIPRQAEYQKARHEAGGAYFVSIYEMEV